MEKEPEQIKNKPPACPRSGMEKVSLFRGIECCFFTAKTGAPPIPRPKQGHILEINYCHSGQIGWDMGNGNRLYLGPGDFSLHAQDARADSPPHFPTGEYAGLTLCIDLQELSANPPEILSGSGIYGETLSEKFCQNGGFALFTENQQANAIFSAFFGQPEPQRLAYQKIKALELLLYLGTMEPAQAAQPTEYQASQVEIIRLIHDRLTQDIGQRITIEALSKQYLMNPTTLKAVFKSVYGTSIAAHIKEHRMELAARLLLETDFSIAEIGQQIGYESQSKFTSAFKSYFHALPKEYRKNHRAQP